MGEGKFVGEEKTGKVDVPFGVAILYSSAVAFFGGRYTNHSRFTTIGTLYVFINLSGNVSGVMMNMPGRIAVFRRFLANMKRIEPFINIKDGGQQSEHIY